MSISGGSRQEKRPGFFDRASSFPARSRWATFAVSRPSGVFSKCYVAAAAAIGLFLLVEWARVHGSFGWTLSVVTAAAVVAVHSDWLPLLRGPSPEEWQWPHRAGPFPRPLFAALAFGFALLTGVAFASTSMARRRPRAFAAALIAGGVIAGLGFQLALLDTEPGGWQQTLVDRVWSALGFLRAAALTADTSVPHLMARYPSILPTLSLHAAVHPPGAALLYRMLAWAARSSGLAQPDLAFAFGSTHVPGAVPLAWVALAGGLLLAATAALTAVPVSIAVWVVRRDPLRAAAIGLLWPFCPGPTIFSPTLVQFCALAVASAFALLLYAQRSARMWMTAALVSGGIAGVSLFFSYGTAPMLVAVVAMCAYRTDEPEARSIFIPTLLAWTIGLVAGTFAPSLVGYPVIATAIAALRLHKDFTATRSAPIWLGFNLLDFVIFFGVAATALAAVRLSEFVRARAWKSCAAGRLAAIACSMILLLDLSGTSRGEVGRLWTPFMPLLFAAVWSAPVAGENAASSVVPNSRDGVVFGALSMLYCLSLRLHWFVGF